MFNTSTKTIKQQQDEISEALDQAYTEFVAYKVRRVVLKNVMLIGRSRTGKSTLQSILVDPRQVGAETTLYAQTKCASFQSYVVEGSTSTEDVYQAENDEAADKQKITKKKPRTKKREESATGITVLNIIDTPGLFEHAAVGMDIQDNATILDTIQMCINREITKFHLVCFCASFESGINDQDIESLEVLINFLGNDISKNSCLIITRCESKGEQERKKLHHELLNDSHFKKFAHYFERGIHFSGVLNRDNWNKAHKDTLQDQFETICGYRQDLIDLFSDAIEPFEIKNCDFAYVKQNFNERQNLLTELQDLKKTGKNNEELIKKLKSESCAIS